VAGTITRVRADAVRETFASDAAFRQASLLYATHYLDQVSQNAVCNRLHGLEERLAKWLLVSSWYAASEILTLTHEFLSHMLGVRRSGVTVAVNTLTMDALIDHTRGAIAIMDHDGLQRRACECVSVLRRSWEG
jgi:CRP-like cAMP-binding protein